MDPIGIITSANGWQLAAAAFTGGALVRLLPRSSDQPSVKATSAMAELEVEVTKSFAKLHKAMNRFEELVQLQRKEIVHLETQIEGLSTGVADDLTEAKTQIEALQQGLADLSADADFSEWQVSLQAERDLTNARTNQALEEAAEAMRLAKEVNDLALKTSGKIDLGIESALAAAKEASDLALEFGEGLEALSKTVGQEKDDNASMSSKVAVIQQWVAEDAVVRFAAVEELAKVVQSLKSESETRTVTEVDLDRRFEQVESAVSQLNGVQRQLYAQVDAIVDALNAPPETPVPQQQPDPWAEARMAGGGADLGMLLTKGRSLQQEFLRRVAERNGEAPAMAMTPSQPL